MKIGKILSIIFGIFCIVGIVYIMSSNKQIKKTDVETKQKITKEIKETQNEQNEKKIDNIAEQKAVLARKEQFKGISNLYRVSCAPCHGLDGRGEIAPIIAGKSKEEILSDLKSFKSHDKNNTLMSDLLKNISDDNLKILADEISGF